MALASTVNRNDYVGNGVTTVFAYTFKVFLNTDLLVTQRDLDGTETTLVLGTDYTVSGVGEETGGNVTTTNPITDQYALTLRRVLPLTQTTEFRTQSTFYPEGHEDSADRLVMQNQMQQDEIDRSVRLPETVSASGYDPELPAEIGDAASASRIITNNATSDGLALGMTVAEIIDAAGGGGGVTPGSHEVLSPTGDAGTDTATLVDAFADVKDTTGEVWIGYGTWKITAALRHEWATAAAGLILRGQGMYRTILQNEISAGGPLVQIQPYNGDGQGITGTSTQTLSVTNGRTDSGMVGQSVTISGSSVANNNGSFAVTAVTANTITYTNGGPGAADASRQIFWSFGGFARGFAVSDLWFRGPQIATPTSHRAIQGYGFYHMDLNRCLFTDYPYEAIVVTNEIGDPAQINRARLMNCDIANCADDASSVYTQYYAIDLGRESVTDCAISNVNISYCGGGIRMKPHMATIKNSSIRYCKYHPALMLARFSGEAAKEIRLTENYWEGNGRGAIWAKDVSGGLSATHQHFNSDMLSLTPVEWYGFRFGQDYVGELGDTVTIATDYTTNDIVTITVTNGSFTRFDEGRTFTIAAATHPANERTSEIKDVVSAKVIKINQVGMTNIVGDTIDWYLDQGSCVGAEITQPQFLTNDDYGISGITSSCFEFQGGADGIDIKRPYYEALHGTTVKYRTQEHGNQIYIEDGSGILRHKHQQEIFKGAVSTSKAFDVRDGTFQRWDIATATFQFTNPVGLPEETPNIGAFNGMEIHLEVTNGSAGVTVLSYDTAFSTDCAKVLPLLSANDAYFMTFMYESSSAEWTITKAHRILSNYSTDPLPKSVGGWYYGSADTSDYVPDLDEGSFHSIRTTSSSTLSIRDPIGTITKFGGQKLTLAMIALNDDVALTWGTDFGGTLPIYNYQDDKLTVDFFYDATSSKWLSRHVSRDDIYHETPPDEPIVATDTSYACDLDLSSKYRININAGATFEVSNPTYTPSEYNGQEWSLYLVNQVAGVMPITWGANFSTVPHLPSQMQQAARWELVFKYDITATKWIVKNFQIVTNPFIDWTTTTTTISYTPDLDAAIGHEVTVSSGSSFEISNPTYTPTKKNGMAFLVYLINSVGARLPLTFGTDFASYNAIEAMPSGSRMMLEFTWDAASSKWGKREQELVTTPDIPAPTASASTSYTPDLAVDSYYAITISSGATFTINNPTYAAGKFGGQPMLLQLINSTGGIVTLSWGTDFWTSNDISVLPASGRVFIAFVYDAGLTKWVKASLEFVNTATKSYASLTSAHSASTTTVTTAGTYQLMVVPTTALSDGQDFTGNTSGRITYTGDATKTFRLWAAFMVKPNAANQQCLYRFAKNGTTISGRHTRAQWLDYGDTNPMANVCLLDTVSLADDDYIEVFVTSLTTDSYAHDCSGINIFAEEVV
jgi:hypothetical protein